MATLIPAMGSCASCMASGERRLAERMSATHQEGHAWGDMAVICRRYDEMDECAHALNRAKLLNQVRKGSSSFHLNEDTIKVLTMHANKGLEFPVVAVVGYGETEGLAEEAAREEARLFYVVATKTVHHIYLIRQPNDRPTV